MPARMPTAWPMAIAQDAPCAGLKAGTVLRVGLEVRGDAAKIVRTSVYDRTTHIADHRARRSRPVRAGDRARAQPGNAHRFRRFAAAGRRSRSDLPTVYDGIYRAAYSYGMSRDMTGS